MEHILIPLVLLAGAGLPVQAGANAQLSKSIGSPFMATTLQLMVGTILLLIVAGVSGSFTALFTLDQVPWWHAMGGLASALYVLSGILLFPRLGAVVTMGLFIAGQILASLLIDVYGLLGIAPKPMTWTLLLGTGAVLIGAAGIVFGQGVGQAQQLSKRLGSIILGLVAGGVLPIQGAVNGLLRQDLQSPLAVGAVSFIVAFCAMALVLVFSAAPTKQPPQQKKQGYQKAPWWSWLGGLTGAYYVLIVFMAMPILGTAATVGLIIAGQQLVSVLVDRYGLLRLPQRPTSALRLCGVVLLVLGTAMIRVL